MTRAVMILCRGLSLRLSLELFSIIGLSLTGLDC